MKRIFALILLTPLCVFGQDAPQKAVPAAAAKAAAPREKAAAEVSANPDALPEIMPEITPDVLKSLEEYWLPVKSSETAPGKVTTLDVRECVSMALKNNMAGKIAQQDVVAAQERIGQAKSERLPQVKLDEALVHMEPEGTTFNNFTSILGASGIAIPIQIIGGLLQPGGPAIGDIGSDLYQILFPPKIPKQTFDTHRDHVVVSQTLYAGGQIKAAIKASKYLADSQEWKKQTRLDQLEYDTRKAYYDSLLSRALVRVAAESVTTFERHLTDTQQMLDVGLVSNFELLRAKTEVGSRQADLVAARNGERLALVNLRRIIGLPQDAPIQLEGKLGLTLEMDPLDKLLPQAFDARPELKTLEKALQAAQQNVHRVKGEYLPKAAATIEYTRIDGGGFSLAPQGWTFTVGGQWDIYVGGKRKHDVGEQKAQLASLEYQKTDLTQLVELDVRQAYIQVEDALAKIREQKGTVDLAREGRRLADLRYQEGVGTQVETLDADLAQTRAESALVQALHDYALAQASLDKAVGRSWGPREAADKQ